MLDDLPAGARRQERYASRCDGLRPPLTSDIDGQLGWLSGWRLSLADLTSAHPLRTPTASLMQQSHRIERARTAVDSRAKPS
jgi:hypothetical protein